MQELLIECILVKKYHILAKTRLPVCQGFFFGSEEYDEYYFETIDYTIKLFKKLVKKEEDFYYQSSW